MAAHAAAAPMRDAALESLLASTNQSAAREEPSAPSSPLDWGLALGISTADFAAHAFTCDATSLKSIRRFIRETMSVWDLGSLAEDLTLVVNELTTNAVLHALTEAGRARSKAWVGMARTGNTVVCAVADPSPAPPTRHRIAHLADSGRGLLIVDALCDKWGYAASEASGKTVWARICLTEAEN
ncbi:ATP-binding protein [Streptomyces tibetensis]|uniref:ATP-binding protein n=1 Tax=Streptomyces tibetensis TaxID=2382123 RepID=UPI0033FD35A1